MYKDITSVEIINSLYNFKMNTPLFNLIHWVFSVVNNHLENNLDVVKSTQLHMF